MPDSSDPYLFPRSWGSCCDQQCPRFQALTLPNLNYRTMKSSGRLRHRSRLRCGFRLPLRAFCSVRISPFFLLFPPRLPTLQKTRSRVQMLICLYLKLQYSNLNAWAADVFVAPLRRLARSIMDFATSLIAIRTCSTYAGHESFKRKNDSLVDRFHALMYDVSAHSIRC